MEVIQTNKEFKSKVELLLKGINSEKPLRYILFNRGSTTGKVYNELGYSIEEIELKEIYNQLNIDKTNVIQVLYHINSRHPELIGNVSIY